MKKVAFYTLGCKVNQYETEAMTEAFEDAGYEAVDYEDYADIYIINTCTVTNIGDRKSRQIIRRALDMNPEAFIAVVGCYSQIAPEKVMEIEGVKLVVGTNERAKIVELVEQAQEKEEKINMVTDIMQVQDFEEMSVRNYKSRTRAFMKIQEGCDQYCTYCIIPYARGHIRSRKPESIIEEVKSLAENGFKEVVLTGIHVASYGRDIGNISLIDIIERVHEIEGIERIRMSSIEPNVLTEDFIKRLSKLHKICRHFHLSLQSGCNETLKRMNRKYTVEEYKAVVKQLRSVFSDVAITTDLIVGFPGETNEEFEQTKKFVEDINFSAMHIFKYSPREGTPAAKFKNQIDPKIKESRSKQIAEIAEKNEMLFKKRFIGRTLEVLFERAADDAATKYEGLTDNYLPVIVECNKDIKGKILKVKLMEIIQDFIAGQLSDF
ncbi:MAG: tRNA (N(6)-L-threonylcarbamoyladenosine(37)-C(2))-methylthiotransferase MtaB [Bacillota bacterium]